MIIIIAAIIMCILASLGWAFNYHRERKKWQLVLAVFFALLALFNSTKL